MPIRQAACNCGQLTLTYDGPDPARISLCQCCECQRRTGSVFSVQTRLPRENVTITGESSTWTFPMGGATPATFRSCDSEGATYHFCPRCGSTVYWELAIAPDFFGAAVGSFTDQTFPPPVISGFEAYGPDWAMNASALPIPHHEYDGTTHGGPRL
ncbi:GFA family protein [Cryobacterium sp. N22]|uniref:GFA family protein n=1 Tax=Cryobacterium sp. N22 TaxID=2048290 RepID=UPI000CE52509|nr:GFA family protein [Cryobacterium sp. N22]